MKLRYAILIFILLVMAGFSVYMSYPYNPLVKYGLYFRTEGAESPSWVIITFYLKDNPDKIKCPWFDSSGLELSFKDVDGDGIAEIIVTHDFDSEAKAVVKVLVKDGKVTGFRVLEDTRTGIYFSLNKEVPEPFHISEKKP